MTDPLQELASREDREPRKPEIVILEDRWLIDATVPNVGLQDQVDNYLQLGFRILRIFEHVHGGELITRVWFQHLSAPFPRNQIPF